MLSELKRKWIDVQGEKIHWNVNSLFGMTWKHTQFSNDLVYLLDDHQPIHSLDDIDDIEKYMISLLEMRACTHKLMETDKIHVVMCRNRLQIKRLQFNVKWCKKNYHLQCAPNDHIHMDQQNRIEKPKPNTTQKCFKLIQTRMSLFVTKKETSDSSVINSYIDEWHYEAKQQQHVFVVWSIKALFRYVSFSSIFKNWNGSKRNNISNFSAEKSAYQVKKARESCLNTGNIVVASANIYSFLNINCNSMNGKIFINLN